MKDITRCMMPPEASAGASGARAASVTAGCDGAPCAAAARSAALGRGVMAAVRVAGSRPAGSRAAGPGATATSRGPLMIDFDAADLDRAGAPGGLAVQRVRPLRGHDLREGAVLAAILVDHADGGRALGHQLGDLRLVAAALLGGGGEKLGGAGSSRQSSVRLKA